MKNLTFCCLLIYGACFSQTDFQIQKLKDFAKIYGIVRYFHPSDESANTNWSFFAAYGTGQILKAKNQADF